MCFFFAKEKRKTEKNRDTEPEARLRKTGPLRPRTASICLGHKFGSWLLSCQLRKGKLVISAVPSVLKASTPDAQEKAQVFLVPRTGKDLSHGAPKKESVWCHQHLSRHHAYDRNDPFLCCLLFPLTWQRRATRSRTVSWVRLPGFLSWLGHSLAV